MSIAAYGYDQISDGDKAKGTTGWFAKIVNNFARLVDHRHDGNDSVALDVGNFVPFTATIAASWGSADSDGMYTKSVSLPAGVDSWTNLANYNVKFMITAATKSGLVGQEVKLTYGEDTGDATKFKVFCNDPALALSVVFR